MGLSATINVMAKLKRVSNLHYQFDHMIEGLRVSADEIGDALVKAGLIEWVEYGPFQRPLRYRETDAMRAIPKADFDQTIRDILTKHFRLNK